MKGLLDQQSAGWRGHGGGWTHGPSTRFRLHRDSSLVREIMSMREGRGAQIRWRRDRVRRQGGEPPPGPWGGGSWEEEIVTALPITAIWSHGPKACMMYVRHPPLRRLPANPLPRPLIPLPLSSEWMVTGAWAKPRAQACSSQHGFSASVLITTPWPRRT